MTDLDPVRLLRTLRGRVTTRRTGLASLVGAAIATTSAGSIDAKDKHKKRKKKKKKKAGCSSGQTRCQGGCVDLKSDALNCGECYAECNDTQECRQGTCLPPCTERACFERQIGGWDSYYQVAVGADNTLVVTTDEDALAVFRTSGERERTIGEFGIDPGEFDDPDGVAIGSDGAIYVSDWGNERIQVLRANGDIDLWPMGQYMNPGGIDVTPAGIVYVLIDDQVYRLSPSGAVEYRWGPDGTGDSYFEGAVDLEFYAPDAIFVLDEEADKVYRFRDGGQDNVQMLWSVGAPGVDPAEFRYPRGLSVSANQVFVADSDNARVQVLNGDDGSFLYSWATTDEYGDSDEPIDLVVIAGRAYVTGYLGIFVYRLI